MFSHWRFMGWGSSCFFFGNYLKKEKIRLNKTTFWGGLIFALLSILGHIAIGKSLEGIGPSLTTVILRTQIILVMLLGWLVLKERLNRFLLPGATLWNKPFYLWNALDHREASLNSFQGGTFRVYHDERPLLNFA